MRSPFNTEIESVFIGDSGSGGAEGLVPAPAAGDAAAGKVLGAGGGWVDGGNSNDKGYFIDQAALEAAYPVGEAGWYAVVGSTDTVWIWDTDTEAWVDSGQSTTGTVTDVSVVDANGISGTVANPTTTPAITLNPYGLVPYTGADRNLDLGVNSLTATGIYSTNGIFQSSINTGTFFTPTSPNSEVGFTFQNASTVFSQLVCNQYSDPLVANSTQFRFFAPKGSEGGVASGTSVSLTAGVFAGAGLGSMTYSVDSASNSTFKSSLNDTLNNPHDFLKADFVGSDVALSLPSGIVNLTNATSNLINFGTNGVGIPSIGTRSAGTKEVYYDSLSISSVDYARGIASGELWDSVPLGAKRTIYCGTDSVAEFSNLGSFVYSSFYVSDAFSTGRLGVSQLAATDENRILTTLDTSTYPDLTEISYVKGATSNLQDQIDSIIGGSPTWEQEIPTGAVDGINTDFTLSQTPVNNSLSLYANGLFQALNSAYTLSGNTITFMTAPPTGTDIRASYQY